MKLIKKIIFLSVLIFCQAGFATEYKKFNTYYVYNLETNGARICWGYKSVTGRVLGEEYFVYGLTNVDSEKQYNDYIIVTPTNDFHYKTVDGENRKIPAVSLVSKEEFERVTTAQQSEQERQIAEIRRHDERVRTASMRVASEKIFEFRLREATNGSPSSQFLLGKMFIKGEYPCDTNLEVGLTWIKKAADQDYTQAKDYLERIKSPLND